MAHNVTPSYSLGAQSGTIGAGASAASPVFAFRWASSTLVAAVKSFRVSAGGITAFTAGACVFDLVIARSWSVSDSSGTAVAWTIPGSGRRRVGMASSAFGAAGDIRIANTGALSAGTRTLDTNPIGAVVGSITATAGDFILPLTEFLNEEDGDYPLVLAQNEGLVLRATVPATGTWQLGVSVDWEELTDY
jgi:hypothetical protein